MSSLRRVSRDNNSGAPERSARIVCMALAAALASIGTWQVVRWFSESASLCGDFVMIDYQGQAKTTRFFLFPRRTINGVPDGAVLDICPLPRPMYWSCRSYQSFSANAEELKELAVARRILVIIESTDGGPNFRVERFVDEQVDDSILLAQRLPAYRALRMRVKPVSQKSDERDAISFLAYDAH